MVNAMDINHVYDMVFVSGGLFVSDMDGYAAAYDNILRFGVHRKECDDGCNM